MQIKDNTKLMWSVFPDYLDHVWPWIPTILVSMVISYIVWIVLKAELCIYDCFKHWHEVGFVFNPMDRAAQKYKPKSEQTISGLERRWQAERMNSYRKLGNCPPCYPNGWYGVMDSLLLKPGDCYPVNILGLNLVIFREQSGAKDNKYLNPPAHILDATCPHLGANLGVGGRVHEDRVECPFHGWQFEGASGNCTHIPYKRDNATIPAQCNIKTYPTCEVNGWIHLWFDAEGRPPSWKVPVVPQIELKHWSLRARIGHEILAHIQELPENAGDLAHLSEVHITNILAGTDLRYLKGSAGFGSSIIKGFWNKVEDLFYHLTTLYNGHVWQASWAPLDEEVESNWESKQKAILEKRLDKRRIAETTKIHGLTPQMESEMKTGPAPVGEMSLTHNYKLFGFSIPCMRLHVKARQIGPGIVHMLFESRVFGQGAFMQYVTPLAPLKQRMVHHTWVTRATPGFIARILARGESIQVERDIMIWNNKKYIKSPVVVKSPEDALLLSHRKWYSQFYSPNSPTITDSRKDPSQPVASDW